MISATSLGIIIPLLGPMAIGRFMLGFQSGWKCSRMDCRSSAVIALIPCDERLLARLLSDLPEGLLHVLGVAGRVAAHLIFISLVLYFLESVALSIFFISSISASNLPSFTSSHLLRTCSVGPSMYFDSRRRASCPML